MNMQSAILPASMTERVLEYKHLIEAALSHGGFAHTFDDIVRGVLQGKLHFYPLDGAFVIMEHTKYSQYSIYHCFLAGGTLSAILSVQPHMQENARKLGAKKITITGRKGFTRVLPQHGWKHTLSLMELAL